MEINQTFHATIEDKGGWTVVVWPASVAFFESTRSIKVTGTMNGVPFQTAFLPWGDGTQFLPVSKKLLKALGKQPGDTITVTLQERLRHPSTPPPTRKGKPRDGNEAVLEEQP